MLAIAELMEEAHAVSRATGSASGRGAEPIGVVGVGWVGLVTAACFASQGHEVWAMDVDEAKVASALGRRADDPRAGPARAGRASTPSASTSRPRWTSCSANARLLFCCVDTPPTYSGDADLSRVRAVVDQLSGDVRARPGDEEHGPLRHRRVDPPRAARRSPTSPARSSSRRAPPSTTSCNPDRVVIGADPGDEWAADAVAGALRAARRRDRPHRRRQRRDDQARLQRLPGDQDLLHQRDRQRLRGGRRRRHRGRPRHGPRRAHRQRVPAGRDRLRRLVASPRTSPPSSSSPATPATTSSSSTRSSRSTSCRSAG